MNEKGHQELLPPLRDSKKPSAWLAWLTDPLPKRFMLPATGLLIMGLDWLLFSEEAVSLGALIPMTAPLGFLLGAYGTYHLQTRYAKERPHVAGLKALLAGILVGVPFPLAGTIVGGWIMATSGLAGLRWRLFKDRFTRRSSKA